MADQRRTEIRSLRRPTSLTGPIRVNERVRERITRARADGFQGRKDLIVGTGKENLLQRIPTSLTRPSIEDALSADRLSAVVYALQHTSLPSLDRCGAGISVDMDIDHLPVSSSQEPAESVKDRLASIRMGISESSLSLRTAPSSLRKEREMCEIGTQTELSFFLTESVSIQTEGCLESCAEKSLEESDSVETKVSDDIVKDGSGDDDMLDETLLDIRDVLRIESREMKKGEEKAKQKEDEKGQPPLDTVEHPVFSPRELAKLEKSLRSREARIKKREREIEEEQERRQSEWMAKYQHLLRSPIPADDENEEENEEEEDGKSSAGQSSITDMSFVSMDESKADLLLSPPNPQGKRRTSLEQLAELERQLEEQHARLVQKGYIPRIAEWPLRQNSREHPQTHAVRDEVSFTLSPMTVSGTPQRSGSVF